MESMWLNNKKIIQQNINKEKPCLKCGFCPYGDLVEEFLLRKEKSKFSCKIFGHDCPMFYHAEDIVEQEEE